MGLAEITRMVNTPSLIFRDLTNYANLAYLMSSTLFYEIGMTDENVGFFGVNDKTVHYQQKAGESGLKDKGDLKVIAAFMAQLGFTGKTLHPVDFIKTYEYSQRIK